MSSFEETEREASELRREIDELLSIDRQELYGAERLGEISFEKHGKKQFEQVFRLLEDLKGCDLNKFPPDYIHNLRQPIQTRKDLFKQAMSLDMKRMDVAPAAERDRIVVELESFYRELFKHTIPFISVTRQTSADIKEMEAEAKQSLDSIRESVNKSAAEAKKTLDTSASVRRFAAKTGTDHNIDRYKQAQQRHAKAAKIWLGAVLSLSVLLVVFAAWYFCAHDSKDVEFVLGHQEVALLFIVAVLLYAIFFCAKSYTSEKHNQVVNNNKANALDTFELFVSSANSEATKDQVLLVSAMAIFANTSTGFGKDQGMPLPPLMEAVKRGADQISKS